MHNFMLPIVLQELSEDQADSNKSLVHGSYSEENGE